MEYQKEYKDIIDNIDHKDYDSIMDGLGKLLDFIESISEKENVDQEFLFKAITKADEIKDEAKNSLKLEGQNIYNLANEFGISLSELGVSESDLLLKFP